MFITIDHKNAATLEDTDNFSSFKISFAGGNIVLLDAHLAVVGYLDETRAHVFVRQDWLERAGPQTEAWREKLSAMLEFARKKGWVDAYGNIQAHVEHAA
jgi:hypothetical protein